MTINRRNFLKTIAAASLFTLAPQFSITAQNNSGKLRIIVFLDEKFPTVDGLNLSKSLLQNALISHQIIFADAANLSEKFNDKDIDLFINAHGSAFPKSAWKAILKYLQEGGNFLNLGGTPFAVPVVKAANGFRAETRQVNFHKRINILQAVEIESNKAQNYQSNLTELKDFPAKNKIEKTFAFYPKLATTIEFPEEAGGDGAREAKPSALIHGFNAENYAVSAPIVMFDRLKEEFAGGRWIFAAYSGTIDEKTIKLLAETASFGAIEVVGLTKLACYKQDEKVVFNINANFPKTRKAADYMVAPVSYTNERPNKTSFMFNPRGTWEPLNSISYNIDSLLEGFNGFYKIKAKASIRSPKGLTQHFNIETGFWVYDEKLMQSGGKFTADRHFLYRTGEPFPVVGATYMASDVARRFLLEPNPAVWDKDFAEMKRAGVNMIRTGIWTAWKLYLDEKGEVKEEVLRAFEAFILTAKKYDIPVIFTFYAFMPEMYGGKNAYLDPKSIAGQKRFLSSFAARLKNSPDIIWDLINEPSFANPKALWSCRPNGDEFEKAAWTAWLKKHFNEPDESKLAEILQEKWRLSGEEDAFALPKNEDFESVNIQSARRPLKTLEFRLFAQDTFENWAREMRETLHRAGNKSQMVTVGQDEAGAGDSPSPQFHADSLDLTSLHNWWANDDLLWDNVVSKAPEKPNLVQETGVMSYEKIDGSAWRTEKEAGNLLERKMALALGANASGFIEWIWNTNPFMNIDNEAGIGFLRVDGTIKPELENFIKIAKFANASRQYFHGKTDEKTLLVIPHTYQFIPRNLASEATKNCVRAIHYHCRQALRAVGEYNLETILKEKEVPQLIILPSAQIISEKAVQNLLKLVSAGSTLAVTGYCFDDEYLIRRMRFGLNAGKAAIPVASYEKFKIKDKSYEIRFAGEKMQRIFKADYSSETVTSQTHGKGKILWCHLPLELGETIEPIAAFYNYALKETNLTPYFSIEADTESILVRPTEFQDAVLYTIINESGDKKSFSLTHLPTKTRIELSVDAGVTELIFIDKRTGKILAKT